MLRHHPDKRKAAGEEIRADDDYFTCITKAYETLSVASKRRAYDSVDSEFDDEVPSTSASNKARFFEVLIFLRSVLKRNYLRTLLLFRYVGIWSCLLVQFEMVSAKQCTVTRQQHF